MLGRPPAIRQLGLATTTVLVAVVAVFQVTRSTGAAWCVGLLGAVLSILFASIAVRTMRQFGRFTAAVEQRSIQGFEPGSTPENLGPFDESFRRIAASIELRIHELKAQRGSLHERSRLLETVLSTIVEGVVAIDDSERVLFANESAKPLLDSEKRDIMGRSMLEVTRSASVHSLVRETLAGETQSHGDLQSPVELEIGRGGILVQVIARRLPGEPCPGVVLIFHDISELRRLEKMRSEFVSNVSHELKTPLTSISAYADTLLEGAIDDTAHNRRFVERINEQADRLYELILDLLRLSSLESQPTAIEARPIAVESCVARCLQDHAALADAKSLELVAQLSPADVQVLATEEGLRAILDNLVTNAIKFTSRGNVKVSWDIVKGQVCIAVKDTGFGIARENQSRVFERFFRSDTARTRDAGGTGLGLSIVKHTAQAFGGRVELASELGVGSEFRVFLPRGNS